MDSLELSFDLWMQFFHSILDASILIFVAMGFVFPFLAAVIVLVSKTHFIAHRFVFSIQLGLGVLNGYFVAVYLEASQAQLAFLTLVPLVVFSAGPANWLALKIYTKPYFRCEPRHLLHFIPGVMASFLLGWYLLAEPQGHWPWEFRVLPEACFAVGWLYSLVYFHLNNRVFFKYQSVYKESSEDQKTQHLFLCVLGGLTTIYSLAAGGVLLFDLFSPVIPLMVVAIAYLVFVGVLVREPRLFMVIIKAIEESSRRISSLTAAQVEDIQIKLGHVMDKEKKYLESDISLPSLAEAVGVTTHQLSEYLNLHSGVSFSRYVNGYRVEEVKAQLVAQRSTPILELAFEAGFNSKSAFNAAFAEMTGTTPSAWRKVN